MKFESKFGIGEIVCYDLYRGESLVHSAALEVVGIYFARDGRDEYICRYPQTGATVGFTEAQLLGDPDFDQDRGCYPVEPEGKEPMA